MKNVIEVKNVSKSFKSFLDKSNLLKDRVLFRKRNICENRIILNNLNFTVKKGESIGIIGRNGCGKSTLLKLLTRIIYPNSGSITIKGKVSSLIELGAGFHPDMSGRENIYTNAAIYGLNKKQINLIIDDIISFSELEEFIDNPVRTYSSGMYMRLAFSVAIHVDADILLIDEILAVGDIKFQEKCFNKLKELKSKGVTIVIVSHSLDQINDICDKCIWIEDGKIKMNAKTSKVTNEYVSFMKQEKKYTEEKHPILKNIKLNKNEFSSGDNLILEIEFVNKIEIDDLIIRVEIFNKKGVKCYEVSNISNIVQLKNSHKLSLKLFNVNLSDGIYTLNIHAIKDTEVLDLLVGTSQFSVITQCKDSGIISLDYEWMVNKE